MYIDLFVCLVRTKKIQWGGRREIENAVREEDGNPLVKTEMRSRERDTEQVEVAAYDRENMTGVAKPGLASRMRLAS